MVSEALEFVAGHPVSWSALAFSWIWLGSTLFRGKACVPPALADHLEEALWTFLSSSVSANVSVFPDGFAGAQHLLNLTGMW